MNRQMPAEWLNPCDDGPYHLKVWLAARMGEKVKTRTTYVGCIVAANRLVRIIRPDEGDALMPISLYRSVVPVAQDLDGYHRIHDALHANPQCLRAGFTIALAPEKSAE